MRETRRRLVVLVLLLALSLGLWVPATSQAQLAVFDPVNWRENFLTSLQTALAILQRVEMIRNQIQQIEWMVENLKDLEEPTFRDIGSLLSEVEQVMRATEGLVYVLRDLSVRFEGLYPAYETVPDAERHDMEAARVTLETMRAALLATQRLGREAAASQRLLGQMRQQALDTTGHFQIFKSGVLAQHYTAQEVAKLNQQTAVLANQQAVFQAHTISSHARAEATFNEALRESRVEARRYETFTPVSVVPTSFPNLFPGLP